MAARLAAPLADKPAIEARLDAVGFLHEARTLRAALRDELKALPDMARALTRLAMGRGGPRDMAALGVGLSGAARLAETLAAGAANAALPHELAALYDGLVVKAAEMTALAADLDAALVDRPPLLARDGGFVADDYEAGLDAARALRDESRRIIAGAAKSLCRANRHQGFENKI